MTTAKNQTKSAGPGRGGRRPGAGRPPGAANKRTRAIADQVAQTGKTPLEIMLEAMHEAYARDGALGAFPLAAAVAPYVHPRLQAVAHREVPATQPVLDDPTPSRLTAEERLLYSSARRVAFMLAQGVALAAKAKSQDVEDVESTPVR